QIILGKVRPFLRRLAEAHPQVLIIAQSDPEHSQVRTRGCPMSADIELMKMKAAVNAGIPTERINEAVEIIQGDDEETITESVNKIVAVLNRPDPEPVFSPAFDPTQGLGGGFPAEKPEDPLAMALRMATRRYR
ncbi:hypothetical protein BST43_26585, partial [Mycobacteroides saopaulense]